MMEEIHGETLSGLDSMPTIVLCGGAGTRLSNVTHNAIPKHLVEVGGKTILEHAIEPFSEGGNLILATGVHGDQVHDFVEARKQELAIKVSYSHDPEPKGVVSAVLKAVRESRPQSSFGITHGDEVLKGFDFHGMYDFHRKAGAPVTVVATSAAPAVRDFAMWRDEQGRVETLRRGDLDEVEARGARFGVGTFICEPEAMDMLDPKDSWEGFLRKLIAERHLYGYPTDARFYNLNSLPDLEAYHKTLGRTVLLSQPHESNSELS